MSALHLLLGLFLPAVAVAQPPARQLRLADSSTAAVVAYARAGGLGRLDWLSGFLRQREGPQPAGKLDAVAESITNDIIAASMRAPDFVAAGDQLRALTNLVMAGLSIDSSGIPYRRASQNVIEIHRRGSGDIRGSALSNLLRVAGGHELGVPYLRSVAESATDVTAPRAVLALIREATSDGAVRSPQQVRDAALSALRAMFLAGSVTNRGAKDALLRFAVVNGWS